MYLIRYSCEYKNGLWRSYAYIYDGANRLTSALYSEEGDRDDAVCSNAADYSEYRTYDLNSSLTSIKASGLTDRRKQTDGTYALTFGCIKDIAMEIYGAQLTSATVQPTTATVSTMDNAVLGAHDEEQTYGFSYDAAGHLISDGLRKQTFEYNRAGLLSAARPDEGSANSYRALYSYDTSGRLHRRSLKEKLQLLIDRPTIRDSLSPFFPRHPGIFDSIPTVIPAPIDPSASPVSYSESDADNDGNSDDGRSRITIITPPGGWGGSRDSVIVKPDFPVYEKDALTYNYEYCANYEYGSGKLSRFSTPVGYYQNGRHYYHITDYQGNVRCIVADNDSLVMAVHYYPGGSLFGETSGTWHNADLFQGGRIEKGYSHLFYDLQNRHYDPVIPHFNSIDSNAEEYTQFSPYIYGLANPVRYRDPDGNDAQITISGNTITITANIYIYNAAYVNSVSETNRLIQLAAQYNECIKNTWGKHTTYTYNDVTYSLVWNINVLLKKIDQGTNYNGINNYLKVFKDSKKHFKRSKVANHNDGEISSTRIWEIGHELGHILGLPDYYYEGSFESYPSWDGNIMATYGGEVDNRNLSEILDRPLEEYHNLDGLDYFLIKWLQLWNYNYKINRESVGR